MPERTCIACRTKGEQVRFFRMVAGPGEKVYAELDNRLPGRGAYCCIGPECVGKAMNPKNLGRTLRSSVRAPEPGEMIQTLHSLLKKRLEGLLGAAWRKKVVAAGRDAALRAALSEKEGCLFLAEDLSPGSRSEVGRSEAKGEDSESDLEFQMTMEEVGDIFGHRPVGVFFVADGSLADSLKLRSSQVRSLGTA